MTRPTAPSPGCTRRRPASRRAARQDPDAVVEHVLRTVLPDGKAEAHSEEDVVLLAVRFE
ncbi:hypothetical protein STENM36S_08749 [Streptomyces tendae]